MSTKRKKLDRKVGRAVIKRLMGEGLTQAQIAKQTGWTYAYVSMIYKQEQP